ncbi:pro-neuregulin-3, membrane-bound isoform-like [Ostrea edulis]|uniref:pro-neuregulin-3, membrane-bound isoform-like n=1 Tax=Ostrea edulis TaxID=37623 RepID=UPI002095E4BB|nr:pro-neuregulin-3, membrane-bound isoform-like [Ostrea edulis]XP_048761514.1 pro-neuregulin-3, membrane-bound isoform-like [Ostrea edulis]XP_048761515.1 pro-neuregulin-3, membrane-bound isoform-like [Ostrea edulis]XP_048761517.1 pro-neuregulin-3, membrane-bound isoform-like [Ostrea edulis]XP_048761518.1 pro-neuregulin-3, membrane-bound isoform-like [Ostrea edulis]XP_048761519.1 pro-neuregulin-3, membrane-bound isoform-like [Ostrea edulis]XP_048761520.1 pro-neuregulin-3, membrane-bound isofo
MHQLPPLLLVILCTLFTAVYSCGRTPATPRPTTVAPVTVTTGFVSHRKPCTKNETEAQNCLNGGTCFVLEIEVGEGRTTHCQCRENYIGKNCFYIDPTLIFQQERDDQVKAASIAASVVGIVLFVTVIVCVLVLHKRYVRKKKQEQEKENIKLQSVNTESNATTNGRSNEGELLLTCNGRQTDNSL